MFPMHGGFMGRKKGQQALLLDLYPAYAAHSLMRISSTYTGPCIDVLDDSNVAHTIDFDSNGIVDFSALIAAGGSGQLRVFRFYDQTGNDRNWIALNTRRPLIYDNAVLTLANGLPRIVFNGTTDRFAGTDTVRIRNIFQNVEHGHAFQFLQVNNAVATTSQFIPFFSDRGVAGNARFGFYGNRLAAGKIEMVIRRLNSDGFQTITSANSYPSSPFVLNGNMDWSNALGSIYFNNSIEASGTLQTPGFTSDTESTNNGTLTGNDLTANRWLDGNLCESVLYNTDQSANMAAIRNNIIDRWT